LANVVQYRSYYEELVVPCSAQNPAATVMR